MHVQHVAEMSMLRGAGRAQKHKVLRSFAGCSSIAQFLSKRHGKAPFCTHPPWCCWQLLLCMVQKHRQSTRVRPFFAWNARKCDASTTNLRLLRCRMKS